MVFRRAGFLAGCVLLGACGGTPKPAAEPAPAPAPASEEDQVAAIADAVNAEADAAHACWKKASASRPDVDGRVVIQVEIGEGGKTAAAEVVTDEIGSPVLTDCLLATWKAHVWSPVLEPGLIIQLPPYVFVAPLEPQP